MSKGEREYERKSDKRENSILKGSSGVVSGGGGDWCWIDLL
jgi:hypothetical protein